MKALIYGILVGLLCMTVGTYILRDDLTYYNGITIGIISSFSSSAVIYLKR